MNFHEFKKVVHQGSPEVHILSNQGDLYLVQIFNDGGQSLLTLKNSNRPQVFHGFRKPSTSWVFMAIPVRKLQDELYLPIGRRAVNTRLH